MYEDLHGKQADASMANLTERVRENLPEINSLDAIFEYFVKREAITQDDRKLGLTPDEEFFVSELTRLIGVEFSQVGLDTLVHLANQKIDSATSKFLDQPKSEKMVSFLAFLFNEFKDAKTESERNLEVYFSLLARVIRLEKINAAFELEQADLRKVASTDALTKIFNRGQLEADLPMIFESERESDQNLALIIFDLDHFKNVNDTYGHSVGDIVLRAVTKKVAELIRNEDKFYRYGGEEFVILLNTHNRAEVKLVMDKIVQTIAAMPIAIGNGQEIKITLSMGGAVKQDALDDKKHNDKHKAFVLLQLADEALYFVKHRQNSRNNSFMIGVDAGLTMFGSDAENTQINQMWDKVGKSITISSLIKAVFEGFKRKPKSKN